MFPTLFVGIVNTTLFEQEPMTKNLPEFDTCTIAIIGLGYVGLPLALEFAKTQICESTNSQINRKVIGFDINSERLLELSNGIDRTNESTPKQLKEAVNLLLTDDASHLAAADVFIVTVPTPIDQAKRPYLVPLENACNTVGTALKLRLNEGVSSAAVVIYESTVYPGATEEICIPILENTSDLRSNEDFFCGYSPERINPGDKAHTLTNIRKVTSGSTYESAIWIDRLYKSIITVGTHMAASIKVAEAAKVIENTQRDLNIALINELAIIFKILEIDTLDVLEAAGSKWNFLSFRPGLVGGHCIGVDPYYLTHRAELAGYHPEVVLAGRRINDRMGSWFAEQVVLTMAQRGMSIVNSKILILGLTFKENCPDLRNTKVVDIIRTLQKYSIEVIVSDPWASEAEALSEYGITLNNDKIESIECKAVILAVAHENFKELSIMQWKDIAVGKIIFDIKGVVPRELNPERL